MFAYIKFLCHNIHLNRVIIVSSDTDVAAVSLYQSVSNLTFIDAIRFKTNTLLASSNACNIWIRLRKQFSHTGKITTFQALKNKIDELTDKIDFVEFASLSFANLSVVTSIQYVCYLYEKYVSGQV